MSGEEESLGDAVAAMEVGCCDEDIIFFPGHAPNYHPLSQSIRWWRVPDPSPDYVPEAGTCSMWDGVVCSLRAKYFHGIAVPAVVRFSSSSQNPRTVGHTSELEPSETVQQRERRMEVCGGMRDGGAHRTVLCV